MFHKSETECDLLHAERIAAGIVALQMLCRIVPMVVAANLMTLTQLMRENGVSGVRGSC